MAERKRRTGRWRRRLVGLGVFLGLLGLWGCIYFVPPKSFKAVKAPRAGRAMNGRVAIVYSKHYQINLGGPERLHPFDIRKYAKIYLKLNTEGLLRPGDVFVPETVSREDLLRVHTPEYLESLKDSRNVARYLEAPIIALVPGKLVDAGVLNAFRYATGGTLLAGRAALAHGIAVNLAGGYHHAKPDRGEGFNIYADMAIAIRALRAQGRIERALIVDLDVHQGNGSAVIFSGDDSVYTFSMHQGDIYPVPKETSDLDVELDAGTGDQEYLRELREHLPKALAAAKPDIVFLQAGVDTLAGDPLARLRMTPRGIELRDATVIDSCAARDIPVVMCLGGGYSDGAWDAQYRSIRRTIETYGQTGGGSPYRPRRPSMKEKLYSK